MRIYLQLSQIFEVGLFENVLKTKLDINWYKIYFWGSCIRGIWVENVFIGNNCIGDAQVENTCIKDASVIKHLEMHLQLFQILELKWYSPKLGIGLRTSWIEKYNTRLETGIRVNWVR